MADDLKTIETVSSFIPGGYGTAMQGFLAIVDFASSFGKTDPLDYAVARLQKQIDALVEALAQVNERLNRAERRIAQIENQGHVDKLRELNREMADIAFRMEQHPDDAKERKYLGYRARVLADRFLLEPDIWLWTDIAVIWRYDNYDRPIVPPEVRALDPDFKTLALPSYSNAILLLLAAIDLDTMGESGAVRQRYGEALEQHIAAVSTRQEVRVGGLVRPWKDLVDPPETLAEMIRTRITCRPYPASNYAAAGECVFRIACEKEMERRTTDVRDVTVMMAERGPDVYCTAPPDLGRFDELQIEDEEGVAVLSVLGQQMGRVLAAGSLREQFIGHFAMGPTLPLAVLYGVRHDGTVDWYRQAPGNGSNATSGWLGPRRTRDGWQDYTSVFPAGGNRFYALRADGELHWFAHNDFNDGGTGWAGPKSVGRGWNDSLAIIPGGDGVLYVVQRDGKLLWYRHDGLASGGGIETWRSNTVQSDFHEYHRLFSVNEGVLYAVANDGRLLWFRHKGFKDGTPSWDGPREVGTGWQNFRDVFGTDDGVVYAEQADGTLLRYIHLAWKTGGDVSAWRPPVPVSFGVGGYRQVITLMSQALRPPG